MSIISNLVKQYIGNLVTVPNADTMVNNILQSAASFVAGTNNLVDDAALAEIEHDVDFHALASTAVGYIRNILGLDGQHKMFAVPMGQPPRLFLALVRGRLTTEAAKKNNWTRAQARAAVAKLTDDQILAKASFQGINRGSVGDGSILAWLTAHLPDILKLIELLLPLLAL